MSYRPFSFPLSPLGRFAADRRGNVAMLFGLLSLPVFGLIGTAIDYGRAVAMKQELQTTIDAAALAATSEYTKTGDTSAATSTLRAFVESSLAKRDMALLPPPAAGENPPKLGSDSSKALLENDSFDSETASVKPKLSARVDTTILALVGVDSFDVVAETKSGLAGKKLELAMMLDVTGSMCNAGAQQPCSSGTKLTAMKDAALDLVDIIFTGNSGNTRVSVVPFSSTVNVGSFAGAATGQSATRNVSYSCYYNGRWRTCSRTEYRTNCVIERGGSQPFVDNAPGSGNYSGAQWSTSSSATCTPSSTQSILPLTNTRTAIEAKINALRGQGGTAGHLGTAWAWYTLSDKWASFWGTASAPEAANPTVLKAAVLMTDGDYTMHYGSGANCNGQDHCARSKSDALSLCQNMKTQGIRVFTVGFAIDDDTARNTLIECASPGDYHFPYSSADMREAFRAIGNALVAGTAGPVLAN